MTEKKGTSTTKGLTLGESPAKSQGESAHFATLPEKGKGGNAPPLLVATGKEEEEEEEELETGDPGTVHHATAAAPPPMIAHPPTDVDLDSMAKELSQIIARLVQL